ncbi:MAG: zinc-ribbon domain-containing protein [Elusimicrobia bacterium]|nr:zinc-ribbon domain-containing protein [Elusimicrobiota bacterium]
MREIARARGGRCLSRKYINSKTKLWWQCGVGHKKWAARPANIKVGSWCPECSEGLGERICRIFFEALFKDKFQSTWPKWLKNRSGEGLQLDGYSQRLGLAFEHDGQQHHRYIQHFHQNRQQYRRRRADDRLKDALCRAHGVTLIRIQAIPNVTPIGKVKDEIRKQCRNAGFPLPSGFERTQVSLEKAYRPDSRTAYYRKHVEKRHGTLLSRAYLGSQVKLLHRCEAGHRFEMRPNAVRSGRWCPACYRLPITIKEIKALARGRGGRCLSKEYIDSKTAVWWECGKGHPRWRATPKRIKQGGWCPVCARIANGKKKRLNIDVMRRLAHERGGVCLSERYTTNKERLLWQCDKGHSPWAATPGNIHSGRWCPRCGINRREQKRRMIGGWPQITARRRKWRQFEKAKTFVVALGLKSQSEWRKWLRGSFAHLPKRPKDIPAKPERVYRDKGWVSISDWLGSGRIKNMALERLVTLGGSAPNFRIGRRRRRSSRMRQRRKQPHF